MAPNDKWLQKVEKELQKAKEKNQISEDVIELVNELKIHQSELESQNIELRNSQEELSSLLNNYQSLYDEAPVGYFTLNKEGIISKVNLKGLKLLNLEKNQIIGHGFSHFIIPKDEEKYFFALFKAIAGDDQKLKIRLKRNEDYFYAYMEIMPLYEDDESYRIIIIEISKEKKEILSENNFKIILEAFPGGAFIIDTAGTIIIANEALANRLNKNTDDIIGLNIYDLLPEEVSKKRKEAVEQSIKTKKPLTYVDIRDGLYIKSYIYPILDEKGDASILVVTAEDITERKKAENELNLRDKQRKMALKAANAGIWARDTLGEWETVPLLNPLFGRSTDDPPLLDKEFRDHIHPEDLPLLEKAWKSVIKGESDYNQEYRVIWDDGSIHWHASKGRLVEEDNKPLFMGITYDITERKKAEEALKESEGKFRILAESSPAAIMVYKDNRFLYVNTAAESILGYSKEDLMNMNFLDIISTDYREIVKKKTQKRMEGYNKLELYELKMITKEGQEKWVEISSNLIQYEGRSAGIVIGTDISKRKKMEEDLKKSEEKSRLLIKYAPSMIYEIDFRGPKFISVNDIMCKTLGYTREELLTMNPFDLLEDESKNIFQDRINKYLAEEEISDTLEYTGRTKDGRLIYGLLNMTFTYEDKKPIGAVVVAQDITERKKAELALKRSEEWFRTVIDTSPGLLIILDAEGNINYVSPNAENMTGYTPHEITKKEEWFVHPYYETQLQLLFENALKTRSGHRNIEFESVKKNGEVWWTELTSNPIYNEKGDFNGFVVQLFDITKRKQAEIELNKAYMYNRGLIESSLDPMITVGPDFKITDLNRAAEKITGYSRTEIIGSDFTDYFEDPKKAKEGYLQVLKDGYIRDFEMKIKNKDGNTIPFSSNASVYKDENDEVVGVFVAARDMTEIRKAQEALKSERELLQAIIDTIPVMITIYDPYELKFQINKEMERVTGWTNEDTQNKDLMEKVYPDPKYREKVLEYVYSLEPGFHDFKIVAKNGTVIDTSWANVRIPDGRYVGIALDIRERKKAEEKLKEAYDTLELKVKERTKELEEAYEALSDSEAHLRIAMDMAKLVSWEYDVESDIFIFDDDFYALYGTTAQKEGGTKMSSEEYARRFIPPEESNMVAEEIAKALETDDPNFTENIEHSIIRADGEKRYINVRFGVIKDEKGQTIKTYGSNQDITERKNAEKQLKQTIDELKRSNEELQSFAYITSHDLQEPLRTLGSYAGLLKHRYKGQLDDDADDFIEFMVNGAQRMKDMIQGILDYSRAGTRGEEFRKFNAEDALKMALDNLKSAIEEYHAQIIYEPLPVITADEEQIGLVFQNLIGNALKFRKKGVTPKINISAQKEDEKYLFSVRDNGIGLEEEYSDKIFEVFKRLHAIGKYKGAGIGLAIVKRIIDRHGGRIWVESKLGEGSTFYFTMPVK